MANLIMFAFLVFFSISLKHPRGVKQTIPQANQDYLILDKINQLIDHTDPEKGNFTQRYYNFYKFDQYFTSGNKTKTTNVILEIGGESDSFGASGVSGDTLGLIASDIHARVISIEHRFFGESHPCKDTTRENLQLLTVAQVLGDLENFKNEYERTHADELEIGKTKWLIAGGSYSGLMSALARRQYPKAFHAALSSSGVLLANDNYTDFDLQDAISMGQECASAAREARIQLMRIIEDDEQYKYISEYFGMKDLNKLDFYFVVGELFTLALQYNDVASLCSPLVDAVRSNGDLVSALAKFARNTFIPRFTGDRNGLLETYDREHMVAQATKNRGTGSRCWLWMCCNEVAYWQVSPGRLGLRPEQLNQDYFRDQCKYVFGDPIVLPNVTKFNEVYGGLNQQKVTRVYYTTGSQDPWTWTCITQKEQAGDNCVVKTITGPEMGHCSDFHAPKDTDPIDLKRTREHIRQVFQKWMAEDDE